MNPKRCWKHQTPNKSGYSNQTQTPNSQQDGYSNQTQTPNSQQVWLQQSDPNTKLPTTLATAIRPKHQTANKSGYSNQTQTSNCQQVWLQQSDPNTKLPTSLATAIRPKHQTAKKSHLWTSYHWRTVGQQSPGWLWTPSRWTSCWRCQGSHPSDGAARSSSPSSPGPASRPAGRPSPPWHLSPPLWMWCQRACWLPSPPHPGQSRPWHGQWGQQGPCQSTWWTAPTWGWSCVGPCTVAPPSSSCCGSLRSWRPECTHHSGSVKAKMSHGEDTAIFTTADHSCFHNKVSN